MREAYLIIDIGTGNSRVAVVSGDGEILSIAKETTILHTDTRVKGAQYFLPEEWKQMIFRLASKAIQSAGPVTITCATASSLRQGIVLIGDDGEPIIGYSNADRRGEEFMSDLDWNRIWELTNLSPSPIFSAVKLLGTAHREPEVLQRTKFFTSISDWVGYLFTGCGVWERAQAMQSALYDAQEMKWSEELCQLFNADASKLPPLAEAGTILGPVRGEISGALGMDPKAVFVVGTADTQAALAGVDAQMGETVIVSGTTSPSLKLIPNFVKHPRTWTSPTATPGQFMLEINTASSGINLQRFKDKMYPNVSYDSLNADARQQGLPETNLPGCFAVFLTGMHIDRDLLTGGFVMRNPVGVDMRPESMYHAMTLNIGMSITMCLHRMREYQPLGDYIVGCGGGFSSQVVGQVVADLTGIPIYLYEGWRESTVKGCYALCRKALGLGTQPRVLSQVIQPKKSEALEDYFEQWKLCRISFREMPVRFPSDAK